MLCFFENISRVTLKIILTNPVAVILTEKKSIPSYSANTYNYNNSHSTNRNDAYDYWEETH